MSFLLLKIVLVKRVYYYFCQLELLNISIPVDTAKGFECTLLFSEQSKVANMATVLINFQQKVALVRSFQHFAIKFLNQKRFLARSKSAPKSLLSWQGKCEFFLLE